mgnify:CR=1 FL=1
MENPAVKDARGKRIVFLSHCCLNQNAKVRGLASFPGAVTPLIELLLAEGVGMVQMTYLGTLRWGQVRNQYDTPMFRAHCRRLAEGIVDQVEDYRHGGYRVVGFIMMDGSPVCGLNKTPVPADDGEELGGMFWYTPRQKHIDEQGIFTQVLQATLRERGLGDLPFIGYPEEPQFGSAAEALEKIRAMVRD